MSEATEFMNSLPAYYKGMQEADFGPINQMLDIQKKYYNNSELGQKLPFVAPKEQALTQQEQYKAQYMPQVTEADVAYKNAQSNLAGQQSAMVNAQIANLPQDKWAELFKSLPDWWKPQAMQDRQAAIQQNPALAGTANPNYQYNPNGNQQTPQSAFASQGSQAPSSQLTASDVAAARQITPSAMVAGANGTPRLAAPVDISQVPNPSPVPQSSMVSAPSTTQQPNNQNIMGLPTVTPQLQQQANIAQQLAVGDSGQRGNYITNKKALTSTNALNDLIYNNPNALNQYAGVAGKAKYDIDKARSAINKAPISPEFGAMQQMVDTYSKITPDALAKAYTGGGTLGSIEHMADVLHKGFSPGATEGQTLNALTTLMNLQATDIQSSAKLGNMGEDFKKMVGVDVDHDFSKEPIVPKMTEAQATSFLHSLSPADRNKYMPAIINMLRETGQRS